MAQNGWREVSVAGLITEPGNSVSYETGSWRSSRPIIDFDKCTHCLFCWVFCPDGAIVVEDSKVKVIDLSHCKGCGICASECPRDAVTMMDETKVRVEETR